MAASTMFAGVGKSGSPAPKPMTCSPAAWSALAFASTASVADSVIALILRDTRRRSEIRAMRPSSHGPGGAAALIPVRTSGSRPECARPFGGGVPRLQVGEPWIVREDLDPRDGEPEAPLHDADRVPLVP